MTYYVVVRNRDPYAEMKWDFDEIDLDDEEAPIYECDNITEAEGYCGEMEAKGMNIEGYIIGVNQ